MKALNDSYDNMGVWTWGTDGAQLCLRYDGRQARLWGLLCGVACLAFTCLLVWLSERSQISPAPFWIIGIITSAIVTFLFFRRARREERKSDLLQIDLAADTVAFPRDRIVIQQAKSRLQFSYELQWQFKRYNSELNYVLAGQRRPLLAQLGTGGPLARVSRKLAELGFVVSDYKSPKEEEPNQPSEPMPLKRHGSS